METIGEAKVILCLVMTSVCLVSPKPLEVGACSLSELPFIITFSREVVQKMHTEEGPRTVTYYFSTNGDYAAMKPDPKSKMGMSLIIYTKGGTALMFNDKQKTVTVVKIEKVMGSGFGPKNKGVAQAVYNAPSRDKVNVTGTGKTKVICGYPAVEYEIKCKDGSAYWYFAKVDFNPIKIYTMGLGNWRTQRKLGRREIMELKNSPMGVPVLNKNYLLVEMSSSQGVKDMETKFIRKKLFTVSTAGYKIINLSDNGLEGLR